MASGKYNFVKPRLTLYKLQLPQSLSTNDPVYVLLKYIIDSRIESESYDRDTYGFNNPQQSEILEKTIMDLYDKLQDDSFIREIVKEIDITGVVKKTTVTNSLDNEKTANINISYGNLSTFDMSKITGIYKTIYDMDLIDFSLLVDDVTDSFVKNSSDASKFISTFLGFVSTKKLSKNVGGMLDVALTCVGTQKIFSASATVTNRALVDSFGMMLKSKIYNPDTFSLFSSRFYNMDSLQIFTTLFNEIFLTSGTITPSEDLKEVCGCVDTAVSIYSIEYKQNPFKLFADTLNKTRTFSLIFYLPFIISYYYYKNLRSTLTKPERILELHDYERFTDISSDGKYNRLSIESAADISALRAAKKKDHGKFFSYFKPYLLATKQNISLYLSQYENPKKVIQDIKDNMFLEFFESKTGVYKVKLQTYNIPWDNNISDDDMYISDDVITGKALDFSDNYVASAVGVKNVIPFIGDLNIPLNVYIDRLLVLKYGFRQPKILENPNAITRNIGVALAHRYSDYVNMTSRKASITCVLTPYIFNNMDIGKLAFFSFEGYPLLMGYIENITYDIDTGKVSTATISMTLVREAKKNVTKSSSDKKIIYKTDETGASTSVSITSSTFRELADIFDILGEITIQDFSDNVSVRVWNPHKPSKQPVKINSTDILKDMQDEIKFYEKMVEDLLNLNGDMSREFATYMSSIDEIY